MNEQTPNHWATRELPHAVFSWTLFLYTSVAPGASMVPGIVEWKSPHLINKEDEARGESSLLEDITQTEMGPEPETPGYQVRSADSIQQVFDREAC